MTDAQNDTPKPDSEREAAGEAAVEAAMEDDAFDVLDADAPLDGVMGGETGDETGDGGETPDPMAVIAALQDQVDQLNDRALRLAADLDNTRRRAEREKAEAAQYGIQKFARDLLGVADNFHRALDAAPADPADLDPASLEGLITGVRMTEKELLSVFERHGVRRIAPKGEKFDPNFHQAIAEAPDAETPAGHVSDVAQPGFALGDRVLRAAMVVVSKG